MLRKTPSGFQAISFCLYTNFQYDFTFAHAIRIDRVEDIVNRCAGRDAEFVATTTTASLALAHFPLPRGLPKSQVFPDRFLNAATTEQLEDVLARLEPVYADRILPFLDEHQSLESIHELFTKGLGLYLHPSGAMDAIAVAYLAGAPAFEMLVEKYRGEVYEETPRPEERARFDALARLLLSGTVAR